MTQTSSSRNIRASQRCVFEAISQIENMSAIVTGITHVEFLSEQRVGVGTRFTETRQMGKREGKTTLEVTEYVPDEMVRYVADQGGSVWDTVYRVVPVSEDEVELTLVMDAKAHKFMAKLINPLIKGMVAKVIEKDMDAVKSHCEGRGGEL